MSIANRLSAWAIVLAAAVLLAMSYVTTALAEVGEDGDGFDGDELLSLPILLGVGILAAVAWTLSRRRSPKSEK